MHTPTCPASHFGVGVLLFRFRDPATPWPSMATAAVFHLLDDFYVFVRWTIKTCILRCFDWGVLARLSKEDVRLIVFRNPYIVL